MCRHQSKRSHRIHPVCLSVYTMTPTKIVKKGKSKKTVTAVGGELERRRDWTERVSPVVYGGQIEQQKIKIERAMGS